MKLLFKNKQQCWVPPLCLLKYPIKTLQTWFKSSAWLLKAAYLDWASYFTLLSLRCLTGKNKRSGQGIKPPTLQDLLGMRDDAQEAPGTEALIIIIIPKLRNTLLLFSDETWKPFHLHSGGAMTTSKGSCDVQVAAGIASVTPIAPWALGVYLASEIED